MNKLLIALLILLLPFMANARSSKNDKIRTSGGVNIGGSGFSIDASFDPRLDKLIPGYRILNVALINASLDIIPLHPEKDKWFAHLGKGKKVSGVIDLRRADPETWSKLPERVRQKIAYPLALPIGANLVVDLFFPSGTPLEKLTQVSVRLDALKTTIEVLVRE
ncbi:MAG: hypothetical protein HY540_05560 [Deltaproteobacteria bacterium]|nr:hypothetical protein [Deltaproteobacteria bacterium]